MVVLLFVVYELYVTNTSRQKQANATSALNKSGHVGAGPRGRPLRPTAQGIAKIYIPALRPRLALHRHRGHHQPDLAIGPATTRHGAPGQPGDMAIAGHRVGEGARFDALKSCSRATRCDRDPVRLVHLPDAADGERGRYLGHRPGQDHPVRRPNGEGKSSR